MNGSVVIGAVFGATALGAGIGLWWAYAASVLWGWFAVPLGLPVIGVLQMFGIKLMITLMTGIHSQPKDEKPLSERYAMLVIGPMIGLSFGYVAKQFI